MSFPQYPAYKDSGVEWLGEVPAHWEPTRLRRLVQIKKRIAGEVGHDVLSVTQRGLIVKDIDSNDGQLSMDYSKYQIVTPGDFAMNHMDLLTGFVDIASHPGVTSPDYRVFAVRDDSVIESRFLLRILQMGYHDRILYAFGQGSSLFGRWRLPTEQFNDFVVPLPPLPEQRAIAAFLDRETARIDDLVAEQERLIELLREKRQAVISHAVTKGLDPTVPMKDSGVEWLGEVPAHWEVLPFRRCVDIAEGQVDPLAPDFRSLVLIAPNHIDPGTGNLSFLESADEQGAISGKYFCNKGDVVYSKIRPALRKVCIAPLDCLCSADMYPLRPRPGLSNAFLMTQILSDWFSALAVLESERVAMPKINRETLNAVALLQPPLLEQHAITAFVNNETARIDALITEAQRAITLLQERRAALTSAAVTGQIDVRGLAPEVAV